MLISNGYLQSATYYSLFTSVSGSSFTIVLVYVDDIVVASNDSASITTIKQFFAANFCIKDLGPLKYFLGFKLTCSPSRIFISQ